jgi:hypothetical protein
MPKSPSHWRVALAVTLATLLVCWFGIRFELTAGANGATPHYARAYAISR